MRYLYLAALMLAVCGFQSCDSNATTTPLSGERLYTRYGCSTCHGGTGAGGVLGPSLVGSASHWDEQSLVQFLVDPRAAIAADARLAELDRSYNTNMRPFRELSLEQLTRIAGFVLSLE